MVWNHAASCVDVRCYAVGMLEVAASRSAILRCFLPVILLPAVILAQLPFGPPEALHAAVRTGNLDEVRHLLATGVDVNARDHLGGTPLLDAAWNGNLSMVRLLLEKGADVNATHTEAGSTALEYAVLTSRPEIVAALLAAHADVQHRYRSNQTITHIAAGRGNVVVLKVLFDAGAPLRLLDANSNSPLDEAVLHNHQEALQFFLSHGAPATEPDSIDGRGPLHEACVKGFADLIPVLLKAGADPGTRDKSGQTALDLALAYKNVEAVKTLLGSDSSVRQSLQAASAAMEHATMRGQVEIVQLLLDSGFDANRPTASGTTYLHDAALKGKVRVAELLLNSGARLDARNQSGGTPLHDAALGGNTNTINLLLDRGAAVDAVDTDSGATPLMLAASLGRTAAVELLLKRGASINRKDHEGLTALDRAVRTDDADTIRTLRESTAPARTK